MVQKKIEEQMTVILGRELKLPEIWESGVGFQSMW